MDTAGLSFIHDFCNLLHTYYSFLKLSLKSHREFGGCLTILWRQMLPANRLEKKQESGCFECRSGSSLQLSAQPSKQTKAKSYIHRIASIDIHTQKGPWLLWNSVVLFSLVCISKKKAQKSSWCNFHYSCVFGY